MPGRHLQPETEQAGENFDQHLQALHVLVKQSCGDAMVKFHYCCWIPNYSLKIHTLNNKIFPLLAKIKDSFEYLKRELERVEVHILDDIVFFNFIYIKSKITSNVKLCIMNDFQIFRKMYLS